MHPLVIQNIRHDLAPETGAPARPASFENLIEFADALAISDIIMQYTVYTLEALPLKGLSHEILGPVFWPVWMHPGLNKNRFWFLHFEEAHSI
jgi:hypothetical protein